MQRARSVPAPSPCFVFPTSATSDGFQAPFRLTGVCAPFQEGQRRFALSSNRCLGLRPFHRSALHLRLLFPGLRRDGAEAPAVLAASAPPLLLSGSVSLPRSGWGEDRSGVGRAGESRGRGPRHWRAERRGQHPETEAFFIIIFCLLLFERGSWAGSWSDGEINTNALTHISQNISSPSGCGLNILPV